MSKFTLDNHESILDKRGLGRSNKVQKVLDKAVIEKSEKYIPKDTSDLIKSSSATIIGSGNIQYNAKYARDVYYNIKNYGGSPLRGAYWFERMKSDNAQELNKIANDAAGGDDKI